MTKRLEMLVFKEDGLAGLFVMLVGILIRMISYCVKNGETFLDVPLYACGIFSIFALLKFDSFPTGFS